MPGGGHLEVTTANVTVAESDPVAVEQDARPGSYVVIRVTDTGTGMDEETRTRRSSRSSPRSVRQTVGARASSVYGTVAQSGGFVLLDTAVGEGSTFSLYLPVASAPVPAEARTILLAEDEEIVRDLTEQILANAGYEVITAGDGAEALVLYREHRADIAGVVTDLVMPGLGGRDLARQIRELDADLPIVFMSGHHEETPETLQLGSGAALLQKPFSRRADRCDRPARRRGAARSFAAAAAARARPRAFSRTTIPRCSTRSRGSSNRGVRARQARDGEAALATIRAQARRRDPRRRDVAASGIDVASGRRRKPGDKVILYTGHNDRGCSTGHSKPAHADSCSKRVRSSRSRTRCASLRTAGRGSTQDLRVPSRHRRPCRASRR